MESPQYYFDPSLLQSPDWKEESRFKTLELDSTKHSSEFNKISSIIQKTAPNFVIEKITLIWNAGLTRMFEEQIEIFSSRTSKPAFQPTWDKDPNPQLRKKVIERLKKQSINEKGVILLPVWHGTIPSVVSDICSDGFAALQKTDSGFFGKGLYFSNSAEYCGRVYAKEIDGKRNLILCWTCIGNPYPVVDGDMEELKGKANYKNYDTHYVPVRPKNPLNPNEVVYFACGDDHIPKYDEIVVFAASQVIPRAIVQGKLINVQEVQQQDEIRAREVVDSPMEISKEFQSPDRINILVWGLCKSGKSSLVNGLINLFRPKKPLKEYAPVDPNNAIKTTHNRQMIPAKAMIEGKVRPGTFMKDKSAILETSDPTLKCHSAILVVSPGMRDLDEDLREFVQEILDLGKVFVEAMVNFGGISPILVISMLSEFETEKGKKDCYNEFLKVTGLPADRVFFFDNYHEEDNVRNTEKDSVYARILMKAYSDAFKVARATE